MNYVSQVAVRAFGLRIDAFYRALCPVCMKPALRVQVPSRDVRCEACDWRDEEGLMQLMVRQATCAVCAQLAVVGPRCIPCQAEWELAGKPEQPLRLWGEFRMRVNLVPSMPRPSFRQALDAVVRYRHERTRTDGDEHDRGSE